MRPHRAVLPVALVLTLALPAFAGTPDDGRVDLRASEASDERLDRLRGGADVGPSLHIAFGIDRLTTVNGAVVASTRFEVRDIAQVTPAEALSAQRALGSLLTLTDGKASMSPLPAGNQSLGTVIQNSLPNQDIRNVLTLNMATNSLTLLRVSNAADQLRNLSLPPGH